MHQPREKPAARVKKIVEAFEGGAKSIKEALEISKISYTLYAKCLRLAQEGNQEFSELIKYAAPHVGKRGRKRMSSDESRIEDLVAWKEESLLKIENKRKNIIIKFEEEMSKLGERF